MLSAAGESAGHWRGGIRFAKCADELHGLDAEGVGKEKNVWVVVGNDIEFRVARNSGGAFSTFTNATIVLAVLAIGLSIWLVRTLRRSTDRATVITLSLVLGGALGNLADRVFRSPGVLRGHVVDFIKVGSFPSFNVADSAITVGALLLVLMSFRASSDVTEAA